METETRFTDLITEGFPEDNLKSVNLSNLVLSGRVMRYGTIAQLPWGQERFEPGAFGPGISEEDIILRLQHDRAQPLARTQGGGMDLQDSDSLLVMRASLPKTTQATDALTLVRASVLRGLSVEFIALKERMEGAIRVISQARLTGLGLVDEPAYSDSTIQARAKLYAQHTHTPATHQHQRRVWL